MKKTFISLVVVSSLIYTSSAHAFFWLLLRGAAGAGARGAVATTARAAATPKSPSLVGRVAPHVVTGVSLMPSAEASTKTVPNNFVLTRSAMSGLNEHPEYPIREEVLQAKEQGYSSYKMKVCKNSSGATYPIPYSVGHCPFSGDGKLYNGPTILLNN